METTKYKLQTITTKSREKLLSYITRNTAGNNANTKSHGISYMEEIWWKYDNNRRSLRLNKVSRKTHRMNGSKKQCQNSILQSISQSINQCTNYKKQRNATELLRNKCKLTKWFTITFSNRQIWHRKLCL